MEIREMGSGVLGKRLSSNSDSLHTSQGMSLSHTLTQQYNKMQTLHNQPKTAPEIGEFTITTHNTTQPTESSPCSPPSVAQQKKEKPNISLHHQYSIKQTSDENREKHQFRDHKLIQHQTVQTKIIRIEGNT
ncbi:hypothetical protein pdam_00002198, partial [Pocillopora damicornis]